jgi:hypothetical protein
MPPDSAITVLQSVLILRTLALGLANRRLMSPRAYCPKCRLGQIYVQSAIQRTTQRGGGGLVDRLLLSRTLPTLLELCATIESRTFALAAQKAPPRFAYAVRGQGPANRYLRLGCAANLDCLQRLTCRQFYSMRKAAGSACRSRHLQLQFAFAARRNVAVKDRTDNWRTMRSVPSCSNTNENMVKQGAIAEIW